MCYILIVAPLPHLHMCKYINRCMAQQLYFHMWQDYRDWLIWSVLGLTALPWWETRNTGAIDPSRIHPAPTYLSLHRSYRHVCPLMPASVILQSDTAVRRSVALINSLPKQRLPSIPHPYGDGDIKGHVVRICAFSCMYKSDCIAWRLKLMYSFF